MLSLYLYIYYFCNIKSIVVNYMEKLEYTVTKDNIHIKDSYKIAKKEDMIRFLSKIQAEYITDHSDYFFFHIPFRCMIQEWRTHNLLYSLHLFRSHTKDVDLNKNKWYMRLLYNLVSIFYIQ